VTRRAPTLSAIDPKRPRLLRARKGQVWAFVGAAGVGKSHAAELHALGSGAAWARVRATDALATLARTLNGLPLARRGVAPWAGSLLERLERGQFADGALVADALVARLAASAPALLIVEDLHDCNAERAALWSRVALVVQRGAQVTVLGTTRGEAPEGFASVHLEPLSEAGSRALLETRLGGALPEAALAWIFGRAQGNPLYTLEYVQALTREGALWSDTQRWRWRAPQGERVPVGIEALIARSLEVAVEGAEARRAVLVARALLHWGVPDAALAQVADLEPQAIEAAHGALERAGVLRRTAFAHPLFAEVARADLAPSERRTWATRICTTLGAHHPRLAARFVADARLEEPAAMALLRRAADAALEAGSTREAGAFLALAAERARGGTAGTLALEAARLLRRADPGTAARLLDTARHELADATEAEVLRAGLLSDAGHAHEAETLLEATLGATDPARAWRLTLNLRDARKDFAGVVALHDAHPEFHAPLDLELRWSVAGAREFAFGDSAPLRALLALPHGGDALEHARHAYRHGTTLLRNDDLASARATFERCLAMLETAPAGEERTLWQMRALNNLSLSLVDIGAQIAALEGSLAAAVELGNGQWYAERLVNLGATLFQHGDFERAEECLNEAVTTLERLDAAYFLSGALVALTELCLWWEAPGRAALALRHGASALRLIHARLGAAELVEALEVVGHAEARFGDAARAEALHAERAALVADHPEFAGRSAWRAFALLERRGDLEGAARFLAAQLPVQPGVEAHLARLSLARLRGEETLARQTVREAHAHGIGMVARVAALSFSLAGREAGTRVNVLGALEVVGARRAPSGRVRELLLALVEARLEGRAGCSDAELNDRLCPDGVQGGALKFVAHRLREALGAGSVLRRADGYALGAVHTDAEAFLESGEARLWRGLPVVSGAALERLIAQLRTVLPALEERDPKEAARLARLSLEIEPFDREMVALGARSLRATGNRKGALELYARAKARFLEVHERLPETLTDFLTDSR
jgi:tetratricopeptide (TPR) repeat protein